MPLQPEQGGGGGVKIYSKFDDDINKLNITKYSIYNYYLQSNINFINNLSIPMWFNVVVVINEERIASIPVHGMPGQIISCSWKSEVYPITKKFNAKYPQSIKIGIETSQPLMWSNPNNFITILPFSSLFFFPS
jgi:hypothetical protein